MRISITSDRARRCKSAVVFVKSSLMKIGVDDPRAANTASRDLQFSNLTITEAGSVDEFSFLSR